MGKKYSVYVSANEVCLSAYDDKPRGGVRGEVVGFSRGAKGRLLRFLNSAVFDSFSFVTLTYRYNAQNWKQSYRDLRLWHKNLCYNHGGVCVVWRQELQKRGAIHFHCFLLDPFEGWTYGNIRDTWIDASGQKGDTAARRYGTNVKTFDRLTRADAGVIAYYMAKYAAKDGDATRGRAWGCLGGKYARQAEARAEVGAFEAEALSRLLGDAGIPECQTDGGTLYRRFYCGHLGSADGDGARDRLRESVQKIAGVVISEC